jgi:hypothetical protein
LVCPGAIFIAENGDPTMMARIGVMRALNRHVGRVFNPSFDLVASLASRSAFSRSRFLRSAFCSCSYSFRGLSDGRNLLASFSRLLMT